MSDQRGGSGLEPSADQFADASVIRGLQAKSYPTAVIYSARGRGVRTLEPGLLGGYDDCSVLFGFGHYYKGPSGVLDSACSGLVLGPAYLYPAAISGLPFYAPGSPIPLRFLSFLWAGRVNRRPRIETKT